MDAQRDHAQAAPHVAVARHAAVAGQGNLDNDADTRNAATEAEELWDSGDRRTRLSQRLSNLLGGRPEGKDAAEAILLTDQDQGTPPTDAVRSTMRSPKARKNTGRTAGRERGLDLG